MIHIPFTCPHAIKNNEYYAVNINCFNNAVLVQLFDGSKEVRVKFNENDIENFIKLLKKESKKIVKN